MANIVTIAFDYEPGGKPEIFTSDNITATLFTLGWKRSADSRGVHDGLVDQNHVRVAWSAIDRGRLVGYNFRSPKNALEFLQTLVTEAC